jgi:phosphoglycerate kinase
VLPTDHIVVREIKPGAENQVVSVIGAEDIAVDIGPDTVATYAGIIKGAKTIIWNGPMGIFEMPPFDKGTVALAIAVAESDAVSVVGGGDSEKAIKTAGVSGRQGSESGGTGREKLGYRTAGQRNRWDTHRSFRHAGSA